MYVYLVYGRINDRGLNEIERTQILNNNKNV